MSMDTTDDLEYAENLIGSLVDQLRQFVQSSRPDFGAARGVLAWAYAYCRPTCRWRDEGECADGDTCGCLCGHTNRVDVEDE